MTEHPFAGLRPHAGRLDLYFLAKDDRVATDDDVKRVTGVGRLASLKQKHGKDVVVVREPTSRTLEADGIMTDVKGLGLLIRFADCQNFVVYAPRHGVVGLIHAGWRGVVAGVIPEYFRALHEEFGAGAADVLVAGGPSLCTRCADFTDPAAEVPTLAPFISGRCVDLIAAADAQFRTLGLDPARFERMAGCTRCDPRTLWTYRGGHREEVRQGYTNAFVAVLK